MRVDDDFLRSPFGELLAAPSTSRLEAVSACLLDCDDRTRVARLRARGPEWLASTGGKLQDYLDGFISKFVLCKKCKNPETDVNIKDGRITHPAVARDLGLPFKNL